MKRTLVCVALLVTCQFAAVARCQETPPLTPEDIIRKSIDARGGKEALAKYLTCRSRGKGLVFEGNKSMPMTIFYLYRYPNHTKFIGKVKTDEGLMVETNVLNGEKAWRKINDITTDASEAEMREARMGAYAGYVTKLFPLLDKDRFRLATLPAIKIKGKEAVGVRVSSKGYRDIRLYFDKKSWLLTKSERRHEEKIYKDALYEEYFTEYKLLKDLKYPMKVTIVIGGKKIVEAELVDIEPLSKIDDLEFSKP